MHRLRDPALGLVAAGAVERLLALADEGEEPFAIRIGDRAAEGSCERERTARERERDPAVVRRGRPAAAEAAAIGSSASAGISPSGPSSPIAETTETRSSAASTP